MTAPVIGQRAEADKLSHLSYRSVNIAHTVELLPSFWSNDPDDLNPAARVSASAHVYLQRRERAKNCGMRVDTSKSSSLKSAMTFYEIGL